MYIPLPIEDGDTIKILFTRQQKPGISEIPGFLGLCSRARIHWQGKSTPTPTPRYEMWVIKLPIHVRINTTNFKLARSRNKL
jgi:hypothetical protein